MFRFIQWITLFSICCIGMTYCAAPSKLSQNDKKLLLYTFEEVEERYPKEPKPILVFLHADWCQYCKNMEQTTFQSSSIIDLLNNNFYFISFDGEQEDDVNFKGTTFSFIPNGSNTGTHELASLLGEINSEVVYPTLVILNHNLDIAFQHSGFLNTNELEIVLKAAR